MLKEVTFPPPAASSQVGLGEPSIADSCAPVLLGFQDKWTKRNSVVSSTQISLRVLWPDIQHPELPSGKPLTTESVHLDRWSERVDTFVHRSGSSYMHVVSHSHMNWSLAYNSLGWHLEGRH